MSRGIGGLQRRVIDELAGARGGRMLWDELKERFPREAAQRSLHRGVRGLLDLGLIYEQWIDDHRWVGLTVLGDDELRGLVEAAFAQLRAVAKARGVTVPDVTQQPSREPGVGTYTRKGKLSE